MLPTFLAIEFFSGDFRQRNFYKKAGSANKKEAPNAPLSFIYNDFKKIGYCYPFTFEVVLCLSIIYLPPPEKDYRKLCEENASVIFHR